MDAQGLTILGHVRAFLHHRVEEAIALHRRALALNPNLAMAWVFLGMAESYAGAHEAALRRLDRYRELAPCHPHGFFFDAARGIPLLLLGRHAEAVEVGRAATALQPGLSYPYKTYLSALGHLGLAEEAAAVRARLLAIEPDFTVAKALRRTPVRREVDRAHFARGLRRAGLG
jgi:tetratricopeptide (TPR) repeat protein